MSISELDNIFWTTDLLGRIVKFDETARPRSKRMGGSIDFYGEGQNADCLLEIDPNDGRILNLCIHRVGVPTTSRIGRYQ
jgi:hypothetical protein